MPKEDINEKAFDDATLIKLDIFEKYFEEWLPVWLYQETCESVLITDFLAGPGCDAIGSPGSPMRIFRILDKFHERIISTRTKIRVILNDNDADKIARLRSSVESESATVEKFQGLVSVEYKTDNFQDLFDASENDYRVQPNLFFVDQYGVKEVNDAVFSKLISFGKTDFLFFISSSYLRRFAGAPSFEECHPGLDPKTLREARHEDIHRIMLDYYRGKIPENSRARLYPFSIKKGPNIYGLVFGSKHPLGVEKFLKIAWKKNQLNGEANFDIDNDFEKRQGVLFDDLKKLSKIEAFERRIEELIIKSKAITNRALYDFTLENGHPPSHAHDIVSELRKQRKIECDARIGFSYSSCYDERRKSIKVIRAVTRE